MRISLAVFMNLRQNSLVFAGPRVGQRPGRSADAFATEPRRFDGSHNHFDLLTVRHSPATPSIQWYCRGLCRVSRRSSRFSFRLHTFVFLPTIEFVFRNLSQSRCNLPMDKTVRGTLNSTPSGVYLQGAIGGRNLEGGEGAFFLYTRDSLSPTASLLQQTFLDFQRPCCSIDRLWRSSGAMPTLVVGMCGFLSLQHAHGERGHGARRSAFAQTSKGFLMALGKVNSVLELIGNTPLVPSTA